MPHACGSTMLFQFVYSVVGVRDDDAADLDRRVDRLHRRAYALTPAPYAAGESAALFMRSLQVPDAG